MKDSSNDYHMTEWLHASARATEFLSATLVDGDCPALVLGIEHVVKARSCRSPICHPRA